MKPKEKIETPTAELIITADGRILAHNLTPSVAALLAEMNPTDEAMKRRVKHASASRPKPGKTNGT